jgi:hypothetical protein
MNAPANIHTLLEENAPARLREIPYNYTSFSDREIVIRLLGESSWSCSTNCAARARPAARHACCTRCWAISGWYAAIPTCRTTCWTTRSGAKLIDALHHRLAEVDKRRLTVDTGDGGDARHGAARSSAVEQLLEGRHQGGRRFRPRVPRDVRPAQARAKVLGRYTDKRNIRFDGMHRTSHVTDATDWRVEYPFLVLVPDSEDEMAGLVKGCIELGLTIIPRGGGTGYTGGAIPLSPMSAVINTEKLIDWARSR